jgi:hypothetical protein
MTGFHPTLDGMIKSAERELAVRKSAYPKWVKLGRMQQHQADDEIRMQEKTLAFLKHAKLIGGHELLRILLEEPRD